MVSTTTHRFASRANASLDSVPCVVERILSSVLYNAGAELHSVEAL